MNKKLLLQDIADIRQFLDAIEQTVSSPEYPYVKKRMAFLIREQARLGIGGTPSQFVMECLLNDSVMLT